MDIELLKLLVAAQGGGLTVKALHIGYQELRRRFERRVSARRYVDGNLDPVLKAADELVGKLWRGRGHGRLHRFCAALRER